MDLMRGLTQADGCAVDGTTAGNQNPIAQMVNQMMNTAPGTGAMKGAQQQPGVMMGHPIQGIAGPSLPGQFAQHQQHLSAIDQGIAHGMGLSAAAGPMGAASASFAPLHHQQQQMNAGDAFMQEFEAERQRQHFGIHGGASGLLGPRGAPMGAASMGDEWINQFEKLKFGAGPYRPGHSMHDAFNQQFLPRSQAWANEFARPPPMAPAQHWQAQQMHTGNAWAEEAAAMKPSITITEINDNEEVTATAENAPPAVLTSDEVEKAIEESDASGSAIPGSMEEMMQKAWQDSMAGKEVDFEALMQKIMSAEQNGDASWANGMGDYDDMWKQGDATDTEEEVTLPYTFLDENKYLKNESAFEEGMKLFNDGRLLEAVMAFEAVVTEDPSNSEAWRMLGLAHQERDEDIPAIACLQRAIEQDAFNLDALFAMGVSLVNEGKGTGALRMLKSWITNNPNFHGLTFEADEFSDGSLLDEVMQLMIKASKHAPNDPGVQEVLGVLYNVSEDYDSAAAAFKKAIEAKPNDYSLWNKLGATLANGKKSEEALPAYHKALELKPRYARAWLNLGIAHNNLSNFFESARCYLKTLDLNPNADHVWENLRWCFIYMKRHDLVAFVEAKNLDAFRDEFQF